MINRFIMRVAHEQQGKKVKVSKYSSSKCIPLDILFNEENYKKDENLNAVSLTVMRTWKNITRICTTSSVVQK